MSSRLITIKILPIVDKRDKILPIVNKRDKKDENDTIAKKRSIDNSCKLSNL